jgi:5-formyltetrahydrofolate cyclo-ligase
VTLRGSRAVLHASLGAALAWRASFCLMTAVAASPAPKTAARQAARRLLREIPAERVALQSRAACARVLAHPAFAVSRAVAVYLPMVDGREVDTWPLVEAMLDGSAGGQKRVYVPKIEGDGHMRLLRAGSLVELRALPANRWGCPEHTDAMAAGMEDATLAAEMDLVVVPALMFAPGSLARLGRGMGFYDRFLARLDAERAARGLAPAFKLGIGFDEQMAESVPAEAHDVHMDAIVCASGSWPGEGYCHPQIT